MIDEKKLIDELKQSGMIVDNEYGNAMVDMINEQPKVGEWVPCAVRLPDETGHYLVCIQGGSIGLAKYTYNTTHEYKAFWIGYVKEENVIAWQPFPESYNPQ